MANSTVLRITNIRATITVVDNTGGQANSAGVRADLSAAMSASPEFASMMAEVSSKYSNVNVVFVDSSLSKDKPFYSKPDADGNSWDVFVATNSSVSISNGDLTSGARQRDVPFIDGVSHELAHAVAPNELAERRNPQDLAADESSVKERNTIIEKQLEQGGFSTTRESMTILEYLIVSAMNLAPHLRRVSLCWKWGEK